MENFDLLPPPKLRMEKWHVLAFARFHPCFRGDGGLLFYLYIFVGLGEGKVVRVPESYIDTTNRRGKSCATTFIA